MSNEGELQQNKSSESIRKIISLLEHENEILSFVKEDHGNEFLEVWSIKISEKTKIVINLIQKK